MRIALQPATHDRRRGWHPSPGIRLAALACGAATMLAIACAALLGTAFVLLERAGG
jgi:hypothetical protein